MTKYCLEDLKIIPFNWKAVYVKETFVNSKMREFPGGPVVKTLLPMQGGSIRSLVRKLSSHVPCSTANQIKINKQMPHFPKFKKKKKSIASNYKWLLTYSSFHLYPYVLNVNRLYSLYNISYIIYAYCFYLVVYYHHFSCNKTFTT